MIPDNHNWSSANIRMTHFKEISTHSRAIYLVLIMLLMVSLLALPFLSTEISISVPGIIRPESERTFVRPGTGGIISGIYVNEGQFVEKGGLLFTIDDRTLIGKQTAAHMEIALQQILLGDLRLLIGDARKDTMRPYRLKSAVYRQQALRYASQRTEWMAGLKKLNHDLIINEQLGSDKVVAYKEVYDTRIAHEKSMASFRVFETEQINIWEQEVAKCVVQLQQLHLQQEQYKKEEELYRVRSPISGTVQYIRDKYTGTAISAGENFCMVSPESALIAECWVSARDVGLLRKEQACFLRIDAFNHNYFGVASGKLLAIDNDYTLTENKFMFKVICSINEKQLSLDNGFTGKLKKGMTLQANFITIERTFWQLLYDRMDDWLNPSSLQKTDST